MDPFITFSDTAKFAEAAKNFLSNHSFTINHSFFDRELLITHTPGSNFPFQTLLFPSYIYSIFFRFLPATDTTIILIGNLFLLASAVLILLITQKLSSLKAGLMAAILFLANPYYLNYAHNATGEIFFIFEILLFVFLLFQNHKIKYLSIIPLILTIFTRQQGTIFILALIFCGLYFYLHHLKISFHKKWLIVLAGTLIIALIFWFYPKDHPPPLSPASVLGSLNISPNISQADYLRGTTYIDLTAKQLISKAFYNLYNFLKFPERLINPVIFILFLLSFSPQILGKIAKLRTITLATLIVFLLATSLTLPNARYIHPILPLIIILASIQLNSICQKFKISNLFLILSVIFIILPVVGDFTLDKRFRQNQFNLNEPPVYQKISQIMAENIPQGKLIITNLDAWAAWYQGLTTMWFPLRPEMLVTSDGKNHADYIVITNYLENDPDFALGDWSEVVYSPDNLHNQYLKNNYQILETFTISADTVYEKQNYQGTILIKKQSHEK
jgi:hypothetical protein